MGLKAAPQPTTPRQTQLLREDTPQPVKIATAPKSAAMKVTMPLSFPDAPDDLLTPVVGITDNTPQGTLHAEQHVALADAVTELESAIGGTWVFPATRVSAIRVCVLSTDGTTVRAMSVTGTTLYLGTDHGAALQAAITSLGTNGGEIVQADGVYPATRATVPAIPPGITRKLRIRGNGGSVITLSAASPRFVDFGRTADYDTFQNIEIAQLNIDCNNVDVAQHVIAGGRTAAGAIADQRVNHKNIVIRDIRAYNIPVTSGNRSAVALGCHHPAANEATQTSTTDVLIENVRVEGGMGGFAITAGTNVFDATAAVNHFIDNVRILGCYHSCLAPRAAGTYFGIQIGQNGFGGSVTIRDFKSIYSGDVGIEIDGMTTANVSDTEVINATSSSYLSTNFRTPEKPNSQRYVFTRCLSRVTDGTQGPPKGWSLKANNTIALGSIVLRDCKVHRETAVANQGDAVDCENPLNIRSLLIDHMKVNIEGINTPSGNMIPFFFAGMVLGERLTMKDISLRVYGAKSGAGTLSLEGFRFAGSGATGFSGGVFADGVVIDILVTGFGGGIFTTNAVQMGSGGISAMWGAWRNFKIINLGDDTGAQGFNFGSTANLAIQTPTAGPETILVDTADFSGLPQTNREFRFLTPPQNQDKVFFQNIRWRTHPKPSAAMSASNFASATFTTAVSNQYVGGNAAEIHFANGTGTGITKIEASKDNVTFEEVWNQASGVMAQNVIVPVDNGDYIRVTFTGTQPTTRVRFRK